MLSGFNMYYNKDISEKYPLPKHRLGNYCITCHKSDYLSKLSWIKSAILFICRSHNTSNSKIIYECDVITLPQSSWGIDLLYCVSIYELLYICNISSVYLYFLTTCMHTYPTYITFTADVHYLTLLTSRGIAEAWISPFFSTTNLCAAGWLSQTSRARH